MLMMIHTIIWVKSETSVQSSKYAAWEIPALLTKWSTAAQNPEAMSDIKTNKIIYRPHLQINV
jgi:hypothetical protein